MSRKLSVSQKRLKYTSYELVNSVRDVMHEYTSIKDFAKNYDVDEEIIIKILKNPSVLSYDMYKAISIILNKSIKELTEIEDVSLYPQFRGLKDENGIKELVEYANNIFEEIIINSKLKG